MIDELVKKIQEKNAPVVVGLDPMLSYLPEHLLQQAIEEYGQTLEAAAKVVWQFN